MRRLGTLKTTYENGGLQTVDDDVLNIVRRIRDISDRVTVYWNDQKGCFTLTETSLDGSTERLVFEVAELDERVLTRLRGADHWQGNETPEHVRPDEEDYVSELDRAQAAIDAAIDVRAREEREEILHEVASYADLDGKGTRATILVPRGIDG